MSIFHVIFAEDGNGSGGSECERTIIYLILHCTCIHLIAMYSFPLFMSLVHATR